MWRGSILKCQDWPSPFSLKTDFLYIFLTSPGQDHKKQPDYDLLFRICVRIKLVVYYCTYDIRTNWPIYDQTLLGEESSCHNGGNHWVTSDIPRTSLSPARFPFSDHRKHFRHLNASTLQSGTCTQARRKLQLHSYPAYTVTFSFFTFHQRHNIIAMCTSFKSMSSESKSTSTTASASASANTSGRIRRQRRSLLDHIVDSVANMAPELERETTSTTSSLRKEVHATKAANDSNHHRSDSDDNVSFLTSSTKHIELQDLRSEQASASFASTTSTTTTTLMSSFSSSWSTTRSHLLVAEEIVSQLESEVMQQEDISYETQEEDVHEHEVSKDCKDEASSSPSCPTPHDPFAKDSNFSVGEDGLIALSSLLSDDEEAGARSSSFKNTKRSWMNRAA